MKGRNYSSIIFTILINCSIVTIGFASWLPEIEPPVSASFRSASEPIRLNFPPDLPEETYQNLALELDAIDISQVVEFEGDQLIYTPPQPLEFGIHELRLVEYKNSGNIEEIGVWSIEVRQSESFQQAEIALNGQFNGIHRLAEDYPSEHKDSFQGGMEVEFAGMNENSSLYFSSNYLFDRQRENTPRGKEFDLGEYIITLNATDNVQLNIGHHNIDHTSLILDGFYRRGVSGVVKLPFVNSRVQAYVMRTGDLTGFQNGLGVTDSNNRISGAVWDYQPFSSNPEMLTISYSHLKGEGIQDGLNIGGFSESHAGNASSLSIDSLLLDRSIRVRGEVAKSNFDFDGVDTGFSKEEDNAYSYLISYAPQLSSEVEHPLSWQVGAEKIVVGSDFRSLANTNLISDRDMTRLFFSASKGQWAADTSFAYEEDNLNNDFKSTGITRHGYISGEYRQFDAHSEESFWHFLGLPTYAVSYEYVDQGQEGVEVDLISGGSLPETDLTEESIGFGADFNYNNSSWFNSWNTKLLFSGLQDRSNQISDSETVGFGIGASVTIGRLSINPSVNVNATQENDTNVDTTDITYSLGLGGMIVEDKLSGSLNFNQHDLEERGGSITRQELVSTNISGDLTWSVLKPDRIRPGVDLRLTGSYNDITDDVNSANSEDQYQLFLNIDLNWAIHQPASNY